MLSIRILMLVGLLISGFVFFSGCVQEKTLNVSNETPTVQSTTFTKKTPTIQPTISTEIYCVSKETGKKMNLSEARKIATDSDIGDQGTLRDTYSCNESTSTWWIDMKPAVEQNACNPAYVVNINTKEVEINWRCTVAIVKITPIRNIN